MLHSFFLLLFFSLHASNAFADESTQQQLESVQTEIDSLNQDVKKSTASKEALLKQLQQQSRTVSVLNKDLLELTTKIQQQSRKLSQLQSQVDQQEGEQLQQLDALNQQIRTAFTQGQPSYLQILLNQHDPATLSRSTSYFRYFNQARQQQLENIEVTLNNLSDEQTRLFAAQKQQQQLYSQQKQKQKQLHSQTKQRQITLKQLEAHISDQSSRLSSLHGQQKSLQALLQSLDSPSKAKPNTSPISYQDFSTLSGSLTWPIKGKILARYGSSRNVGKLTWQGILISAPAGKDVVASAPGKVVFADWLRGFGLLLIIDHGKQYMTLYGHNETLLKQAGETVSAGELIAQSGDKGVREHAGLYFEIRHKGSPTNPLNWLRKQS